MMNKVSPKLQKWLDNYNNLLEIMAEKGFKQTATNAREGLAILTRQYVSESPDVAWIQDDLVMGPHYAVPVRIYHPEPDSKLPVLIYYHGGGHMAGSVTVYDPICRKLALKTKHILVSVDYRLAPECPYPAGVKDAYYVAKNVWSTLDARQIKYQRCLAIAGDSAGGALSATVSHISQYDAGLEIKRQALIYPSLDYTLGLDSVDENAAGYLLQKEKIIWYFDHYFQHGENRKSASPLHMECTSSLPQTLVVTAGFCPLRDEGLAYVKKLKAAGVPVDHMHLEDMIHAFMNMEDLVKAECESVYEKISDFLKAA
jgi:acetyl esterase/lipase